MPSAIQIPVRQTGLEKSIQDAMNHASKNAHINLGTSARHISSLSQPLGKITGQADQFTRSMEAANARVFAFGASVGIIAQVSKAFRSLLVNTVEVEKTLTDINSVFQKTSKEIEAFGNGLFDVARNTGQSFKTVAEGALELSRQGLSAEESLKRVNDAMILARLSGLDAAKAVEGLTAAINSFKSEGLDSAEIMNKMVAVAQKYAVSERDLVEGVKRSAAVANQAGVSFDNLLGMITAVQEKTARGGAVIGNSLKTIFARMQNVDVLTHLQDLKVNVVDLQGAVLPATTILQNLGKQFKSLSQLEQANLAKKLGGIYQLSNLLALVDDFGSSSSVAFGAAEDSANALGQAYQRNADLNVTLSAMINSVKVSYEQLTATFGKIGLSQGMKDSVIKPLMQAFEWIQKILNEDSAIGSFAKTLVKGIGGLLGPGLALAGAIILKLSFNLVKFGAESLRSFFGLGKAAKELQTIEQSVAIALASNLRLQKEIYALEGNRLAQATKMAQAIGIQEAEQRRLVQTSSILARSLYGAGVSANGGMLRAPRATNAASGIIPAHAKESMSIQKGVGGARPTDRPVSIPNFNFGGGKKGSVVAHTGEYIVPNFAGSGGSAIFNRDMVKSMGMPAGAKKINASGGFIPNFAKDFSFMGPKGSAGGTTGVQVARAVIDAYEGGYALKGRPPTKLEYESALAYRAENLTAQEQVAVKSSVSKSNTLTLNTKGRVGILSLFADSANQETLTSSFSQEERNRLTKYAGKDFSKVQLTGVQNKSLKQYDDALKKKANEKDFRKVVASRFAAPIARLGYDLVGRPFQNTDMASLEKSINAQGSDPNLLPPSAQGEIFEAAIRVAVKSMAQFPQFQTDKDFQDPFDFIRGRGADSERFIKNFGFSDALERADAKRSSSNDAIGSLVGKVIRDSMFPKLAAEAIHGAPKGSAKNAAGGFIPNFAKGKGGDRGRLLAGNDFEKSVFGHLGLEAAGSRTLDFPMGLLDSDKISEDKKQSIGIQGSFGDLKLSDAKENKQSLLGKLITYFGLSKKIQGELDSGRRVSDINLNKMEPRIDTATLFYQGSPSVYRQETVRQTIGSILHAARPKKDEKSRLLKNFKFARTNPETGSSVALKDAYKNKFIEASVWMDGIIDPAGMEPFASGFIPNFGSGGTYLGSGVDGSFYDLRNGVGVKRFSNINNTHNKATMDKKIIEEYAVSKLLSENTLIRGITAPKVIGTLDRSLASQRVGKAVISDPLARSAIGGHESRTLGGIFSRLLSFVGIDARDLHGSNYTLNAPAVSAIKQDDSYLTLRDPLMDLIQANSAFWNKIVNKGGVATIIDAGYIDVINPDLQSRYKKYSTPSKSIETDQRGLENSINNAVKGGVRWGSKRSSGSGFGSSFASGYVPNFTNPLSAAIKREVDAGIPASKIYIDKSSSLKNPSNPMGLMVANRIDEPTGGSQGIRRAVREGRNPQTYGAANGLIPNFASFASSVMNARGGSSMLEDPSSHSSGADRGKAEKALTAFASGASKAGADMDKLAEALRKKLVALNAWKPDELVKASQEEAQARKARAENLKAQNAQKGEKILSNPANQKLTASIDKIIKSYTDGAITQDKMNAKIKAQLQSSSLTSTQQGRVLASVGARSSAAAERSANEPKKGPRDLLGTTFALQGVFAMLGASAGDATKGFDAILASTTRVAGTFTSYLMGAQALTGMAKEGGAAAKVLGKFGLYGALAMGAWSAWKEYGKYMDNNNLALQKSVDALNSVSEAASKASINLNMLSPSRQGQIKNETKADLKRLGKFDIEVDSAEAGLMQKVDYFVRGKFALDNATDSILGKTTKKTVTRDVDYSGLSDDQKTALEGAINQSKGAGTYTKGHEAKIRELMRSDFKLEDKEAFEIADFLNKDLKIKTSAASEIMKGANLKFDDKGLGEKMAGMSLMDFEGQMTDSSLNKKGNPFRDLMSQLYKEDGSVLDKEAAKEYIRLNYKKMADQSSQQKEMVSTAREELTAAGELAFKMEPVSRLMIGEQQGFKNKQLDDEISNLKIINSITDDLSMTDFQRNMRMKDREALYGREKILLEKNREIANSAAEAASKITGNVLVKDLDRKAVYEQSRVFMDSVTGEEFDNIKDLDADSLRFTLGNLMNSGAYGSTIQENTNYQNLILIEVMELIKARKASNFELDQENKKITKNTEEEKKRLAVAESRSKLMNRIQNTFNVQADNKSLQASSIGRGQSLADAQKDYKLAQLERNAPYMGIGAITKFDMESKIIKDNAIQKIESDAQRGKLEADAEYLRSVSIEKNIQALVTNSAAIDNLTATLKNEPVYQGSVNGAVNDKKYNTEFNDIGENSTLQLRKLIAAEVGYENKDRQAGFLATVLNRSEIQNKHWSATANDTKYYPLNMPKNAGLRSSIKPITQEDLMSLFQNQNINLPFTHNVTGAGNTDGLKLLKEAGINDLATAKSRGVAKEVGGEIYYMKPYEEKDILNKANGLESSSMDFAKSLVPESNMDTVNRKLQTYVDGLNLEESVRNERLASLKAYVLSLKGLTDTLNNERKIIEVNQDTRETTRPLGLLAETDRFALKGELATLKDKPPSTMTQGMSNSFLEMEVAGEQLLYKIGRDIPTAFAEGMANAFVEAIDGASSVEDALVASAHSFVKEMNKQLMSNLIGQMMGGLFGGGSQSSGMSGGMLSGIGSLIGSFFGGGVQTNAAGGPIRGGSGMKDDVPSMLMGGEYVIKKDAVSKYGESFLNALNNKQLSGFAKGGPVPQTGPRTNYFMPGTYGRGDIRGQKDLLGFASQGYSNISNDFIGTNRIQLGPESMALTNLARMSDEGMMGVNRKAKQDALGLYVQERQAIISAEKSRTDARQALTRQVVTAVVMAGLSSAAAGMANGAANATSATGGAPSIADTAMGGVKGIWSGYDGFGGLSNIFSGNGMRYTGKIGRATVVGDTNGVPFGTSPSSASGGYGGSSTGAYGSSNGIRSASISKIPILTTEQPSAERTDAYFGSDTPSNGVLPPLSSEEAYQRNARLAGFGLIRTNATGGSIQKSSGIDTIPAMLSGGEFVMNSAASQAIGAGNLAAMNAGAGSMVTEETTEKLNAKLLAKLDELIEKGAGAGNITINVDGKGKESESSSAQGQNAQSQLARRIKDVVLQVLEDQKRLGGSLRRG